MAFGRSRGPSRSDAEALRAGARRAFSALVAAEVGGGTPAGAGPT
jgi:hypothetical protein